MVTSGQYLKERNPTLLLLILALTIPANWACNTSRQTQGTIIGATVGAATGAVLAKNNRAVAIIMGAAIGGVAGNLIGKYMDKQAAEIQRDLKGARVERVGEGIVVTFDSGLLFDFDSYALRQQTRKNLDDLARTLNKYEKTKVMVLGHTDSTGEEAYNSKLSVQRAGSVKEYLASKVTSSRLKPQGLGENDPIASNDTEAGRQKNRRVEITIVANRKLIRDAKKGRIPGA